PLARRRQRARRRTQTGDGGGRGLGAPESAGAGGAERGACAQPLDVLDRLDGFAEPATIDGTEGQLLDGVEAIADRLERDQRTEQPRSQQPAADRGHRTIELVEQRAGASAIGSLDDLEVLQRRRIDEQAVRALAICPRSPLPP